MSWDQIHMVEQVVIITTAQVLHIPNILIHTVHHHMCLTIPIVVMVGVGAHTMGQEFQAHTHISMVQAALYTLRYQAHMAMVTRQVTISIIHHLSLMRVHTHIAHQQVNLATPKTIQVQVGVHNMDIITTATAPHPITHISMAQDQVFTLLFQ